ncbi:hypothetical protein QBC34DRAFT_481428 [Podospora aff. communis PSN243]|uniref:Heterokaryon incompatibility domain-containing protein n=1 Tax=Podospora aff. communis PSN243 TaxID=3040156 RepID=A0AAV9H2P3_9PEZI|nr:hypothetical protein QBC34DRAFT_481428 [Podospora aff. communis PSN243]
MVEAVPFETHSCDQCQKLVIDLRASYEKSSRALRDLHLRWRQGTLGSTPAPEKEDSSNMAEQGVLFDVTFADLCAGAALGCQLFDWILDDECISRETIHSLARKDGIPIDDPENKIGSAFRDSSLWVGKWLPEPCPENTLASILPSVGDSLDQCRLWASTYQGSGNPLDIEFFQFLGLWDPATQKIVYRTRHGFQIFTRSDDAAAYSISNRPIGRYPGSAASLAKISSWLQNCQEHHGCKTTPKEMPTRVVHVTGTPEAIGLRLCLTENLGPGGEQDHKCTAANIATYQNLIPLDEQPATVRDAARVCMGMGLRYLWIDALCIVQDDPHDKRVEIAKMPSIYGGATVTIVAARSASSADGFLGERLPGPRAAATISYRCIDGQLGTVTLARLDGDGESGFEPVEPIDERGWTLQERLLSSRIVEFGSRQTRWICPETRTRTDSNDNDDDLTDGWRRRVPYSNKRKTEGLHLDVIRAAKPTIDYYGRPRASRFADYHKAMDHWEQICATFTQRALTLPADRAVAIAGLAQTFAEFSGDRYLAGLWKSCFHSGLLWSIDHTSREWPNSPLPRPATYQGPSWSWLAVNGPVRFARVVLRPAECVAEVLRVETEPASPAAPFALVRPRSGRLTLCARTHPGFRRRVPLRSPGRFRDEVTLIGIKKPLACYATVELRVDVLGEGLDEDEERAGCLLVEITRRMEGEKLSSPGLVLRWSSPERKTYSRVGVFSYHGEKKGRVMEEFWKEGDPKEVEFDWFSDEPMVVEII